MDRKELIEIYIEHNHLGSFYTNKIAKQITKFNKDKSNISITIEEIIRKYYPQFTAFLESNNIDLSKDIESNFRKKLLNLKVNHNMTYGASSFYGLYLKFLQNSNLSVTILGKKYIYLNGCFKLKDHPDSFISLYASDIINLIRE